MRHNGIDVLIDGLPEGIGLVLGRVYDPEYAALLCERAQGEDVRFVHDASDEVVAEHCGLDLERALSRTVGAWPCLSRSPMRLGSLD